MMQPMLTNCAFVNPQTTLGFRLIGNKEKHLDLLLP